MLVIYIQRLLGISATCVVLAGFYPGLSFGLASLYPPPSLPCSKLYENTCHISSDLKIPSHMSVWHETVS